MSLLRASIASQLLKSFARFRNWDASEIKPLCAQFTSLARKHSRSVIVYFCLLMATWCTKVLPVRVASTSTCRLKAGIGIHATISCVNLLSTIRNRRKMKRKFSATWKSIKMNKKRVTMLRVKKLLLALWTLKI